MGTKLSIHEMDRLSPQAFRKANKIPVVVMLDHVRSMNNVGSVFRTADAFRVERLILAGITPTPPHREITKTAIGAEQAVLWESSNDSIQEAITLNRQGYQILALEQAHDSIPLQDFQVDPNGKYLLILGHEIQGVNQALIDLADAVLEIPQFGTKHSLNVSVAAGIAIHHLATPLLHSLTHQNPPS